MRMASSLSASTGETRLDPLHITPGPAPGQEQPLTTPTPRHPDTPALRHPDTPLLPLLRLHRRPVLSLQLPSDWPAMAVELLGACPDMGFSKAWLAQMSYAHKDAAHGGGASKDAQALTQSKP